jgi:hypothetical protein
MHFGLTRKNVLLLIFLGWAAVAQATSVPLNVKESDGSPDVKVVRKMLITNGSLTDNGSGTVSIVNTAAVITPGGADTQVQFNDAGAYNGDAGLTYISGTSTTNAVNLSVTGGTTIGDAVGDTVTVNAGAWSLGNAMTLSQAGNAWSQTFTDTTGTGLAYAADSLTTGGLWSLTSNSASASTGTLIQFTNTNAAATGATPLGIEQNANQSVMYVNQKANGNVIAADVSDNIATDKSLVNVDGTVLDTATNVIFNQISTTSANGVGVTAFKIERGANDALIKFSESLGKWQLDQGDGGGLVSISSVVAASTTTSQASNTTAETNFSANYSLPASSLQAGEILRVTARGVYTTAGTAPTLNMKVKFGATALGSTGATATTVNMANRGWELSFVITDVVTGAAGSVQAQGYFIRPTAANAGQKWMMVNAALIAIDTTAAQTLQISAQWSVASTANIIQIRQFIVEEL